MYDILFLLCVLAHCYFIMAMHTLVVKAAFVSSSMPSQHSDTQLDTGWCRSALCVSVHMQPSHSKVYMLSFHQSDSHP